MTLEHIKLFLEAARYENFSKAAEHLYIAQSSLSRQIAALEKELDTRLFQRSGKRVSLTPAGKFLYEQMREMIPSVDYILNRTQQIGRGRHAALTVGLLEGSDTVPELLESFSELAEQDPTLEIKVERGGFSALRHGLDDGRYDLIITPEFEAQSLYGIQVQPLLHQNAALLIPAGHPLAGKADLTLADFARESFVCISEDESPGSYNNFLLHCELAGFYPDIVRKTNSLESLFLCVEAGFGIALLDANTRLNRSEMVRTLPVSDDPPTDVAAIWKKNNSNPFLPQLIEQLKKRENSRR